MFKKILYIIVIAFILFILGGLLLPKTVHVERAVEISRPASTLYTVLNDFRTFAVWSPWSEKDPDIVYEFSGAAAGSGAQMSWSGDPRLVGKGWQEITESTPWSLIRMRLDFDQQGRADSYFQITPTATGSTVTWGFDSNLVEEQGFFGSLLARYFGLFFDQWIGADYEQGLSRLKTYAESLPATDFSELEVEIIEVEPLDILYIATNSRQAPDGDAVSLAAAYQEIILFMTEHSIEMQSQPMAITRAWDAEDYRFDAAIPVATAVIEKPSGNVQAGQSPSGLAVRVVHRGPYDRMGPTYERLAAYMTVHGLKEGRVSWEHYISDPGQTPQDEILTHIYFLIEDEH